ncbi:MAG: hypothetical protein RhofKO_09490 [Rhodothermales bacterium]
MKRLATLATVLFLYTSAYAQMGAVTMPPSGANQKSSVTQWMGLVSVTITYNSPDVTSPSGQDRTGQVWGRLVPYGLVNLGFGSCGEACPWRAGANENTVLTVSHDVEVQGQPLAAGSYGVHLIPQEEGPWTLILSNNSTAWGSFSYDQAEDALRVEVTPKEHAFTEWLTFAFTDRQLDQTTAELQWENLAIPFTIAVPDINEIYMTKLRQELQSTGGFAWYGWNRAARFALRTQAYPEEALAWAEQATGWGANATTKTTLAWAQAANGQTDDARATIQQVANDETGTASAINQLARGFLSAEQPALAMAAFEANAAKHPDAFVSHYGLALGHQAQGNLDQARTHAQHAAERASNPREQRTVEALMGRLEN